jgi:molecular chaperone HtpG
MTPSSCVAQNRISLANCKIEITVRTDALTVADDGIGMTEDVLKNNFWKAGSSGKKTDLAQRSGVIGTFGIGAMANFGVCTELRVETRNIASPVTLVTAARRSELRIGQDCIDLEAVHDDRGPGTTVYATLDPSFSIDESSASEYLRQYVQFLPVPVFLNRKLISQQSFEGSLGDRVAGFEPLLTRAVSRGDFSGTLHTRINAQARILARLHGIALSGNPVAGEVFLVQQGGQTFAPTSLPANSRSRPFINKAGPGRPLPPPQGK